LGTNHRRRELERSLKEIENRLRGHPTSIELKFERARVLDRLGKAEEARQGYVEILQREPAHFGALNDLGMLLYRAGRRADALTCFSAAVAKHPRNAIGHANLAFMLLRGGDAQQARRHYEAALQLDPQNAEAHRGLALALGALGEEAAAQRHRDAGFRAQPLVELPYRGSGPPVRVLLVVSESSGNVPVDRLLDDRTFMVAKLTAEYYDPAMALPAHDLLFNAIGDAEAAPAALHAAQEVAERSGAPLVNPPAAVLQTGRAENAQRMSTVAGLVVPRVTLVDKAHAARAGLGFPLLLRSPGYHTGQHFERVDRPDDVARVAARLPGERLLAIEYLDLRDGSGSYRKYRVIIAGKRIFPLHLAISTEWKVHYFSAGMAERADWRAREAAFLNDMNAHLGEAAVAVLHEVRHRLGLDYGGIDFSLDSAGKVVLFEANATMILPTIEEDERWAYRRAAVARIEAAVREMLLERASVRR
jgi:Tfp pilus assembly protein PilF/glutathione synthase/RimK-type ligase-like ATP-grasp enzyme